MKTPDAKRSGNSAFRNQHSELNIPSAVCVERAAPLSCFEHAMTLLRKRLRLFAAAWLIFQATSLSALVPRACCLAHQGHVAAATDAADREEQASVSHCAEPAESATASAPHAAQGHDRSARPAQTPRDECAIRGTCGGPAAALFSVISTEGVLATSLRVSADFPPAGAPIAPRDQLIGQFDPPEAPPPRT